MAKRMLIDAAHPEETRVVVLSGHRLEEFDFETSTKKQIKGNIYLAKVTRVEPSLQAAFVEYGGNRHGFLAFGEIHPDYYRIPIADRQAAIAADRAAEEAANEREDEGAAIEPAVAEAGDEPAFGDHLPERMEDESLVDLAPPAEDEGASESEEAAAAMPSSGFIADEPEAAPTGAVESSEDLPVAEAAHTGDAFAEDDAVQTGDLAETAGQQQAAAIDAGDAGEAAETPAHHTELPAPSPAIETVGGDELEEAARPRARPHRHYKIQEVIKRRQIMLVQVTKEERGNKGAALTTYISLAGRYCVLMPNTPRGGGVSRKITSMQDRRRLKDLMSDLEVPDGMGVIVRTAGSERSKAEIKRDFEYLLRLWDDIRELTLKSTAPALIYEEGNLIKRTIRDLYARDIDEVLVDGREGYETAKAFMRMLMPSHAKRVKLYNDPSVPLLHRFQVEGQLDAIHSPVVQLRSGGYIVINPTEALVAIDVNSGRSTRERNIEETALKTNLEAAEEVARQLRLRDLAGLIVIDFIDMEEHRHNGAVERRLKEAMRHDRARIQFGRISPFGLLELSRQRLRPSLLEASTQPCPHCNGTGHIRSTESTALHVLRAIEEEGMRRRTAEITVAVPPKVALYVLNHKRATLQQIEGRYGCRVTIDEDESLVPPAFRLDRVRAFTPAELAALPVPQAAPVPVEEEPEEEEIIDEAAIEAEEEEFAGEPRPQAQPEERERGGPLAWLPQEEEPEEEAAAEMRLEPGGEAQPHGEGHGRRRRRRRRRGRGGERGEGAAAAPGYSEAALHPAEQEAQPLFGENEPGELQPEAQPGAEQPEEFRPSELAGGDGEYKRRRRGRRGGRRRRHGHGGELGQGTEPRHAPQLELRPGEPGYSGPQVSEFDGEDEFTPGARSEPPHPAPSSAPPAPAAPEPYRVAPEPTAEPPRQEAPAAPHAAPEPERAPAAYNVPPARDVTGPPANPRRGWWRR